MNIIDNYKDVLNKYAVFDGRAGRGEYWYFTLANFIIGFVLGFIGAIMKDAKTVTDLLFAVYVLAILLPSIAVSIRRLHDTNRSGWWLLVSLIPFVGPIVLLVFMILDSTPGQNAYGPNPKGAPAAPVVSITPTSPAPPTTPENTV